MVFEANLSLLYSDTPIPDVFLTEYLPSLEGDFVKVYMYCQFLSIRLKQISAADLAKKLELKPERVTEALACLERLGIITRNKNGISMVDLKEKEIRKIYRLKGTSTPEEAALSMERNKKRNKLISSINNAFFQGIMTPSWYTDIDAWFDKYQFEEDVMFALFKHCYDYNGLSRQYIAKVADNWHSKNIKNSFDLDRYSLEVQHLKKIRSMIMKNLRRKEYLTKYEEAYLDKWVFEYGYDLDIIELALMRTTSTVNPSFAYINKILSTWHENACKTKEDIEALEAKRKTTYAGKSKQKESRIPQKENFEQRKYDDEYFDRLFKDV